MTPRISVIVPVYNGEAYLGECLASIAAQNLRPVEVIVVDDGSTDGSARLATAQGARLLQQANRGPAAARNAGIAAASGELLAFLDADDIWPADSLSLRCQCLLEADADIAHGLTEWQKWLPAEARWEVLEITSRLLFISSILFRRRAFEQIGVFDEDMRFSEDVDWCLRAQDAGLPRAMSETVVHHYRFHGSNMTLQAPDKDRYLFMAMRRSVLRKRAMAAAQP
ncbi:MAG: glycosyltransferase family A protein [Pseudomonadota bacterium]